MLFRSGAGPNLDNKDPLIVPIGGAVPPPAGADLTEFLTNGLTDPRVRDSVFPFDRPTLASERIPANGVQFGTGSAGTGARVPTNLSGTPGNVGNVDFRIGIANGRGGALAALVLNFGHAPLGTQFNGVNIHVDLQNNPANAVLQLGGAAGAAGAGYGTVKMPLPNMPVLVGLTLTSQWFVFDSGVASGLASSPGADIRFF